MSNQGNSIPFLSLEYGDVNPNHKLKLLALVIPQNHWITNIAFARNDDSLYLAPQLNRTFTLVGLDKDRVQFSFESSPGADIPLSLHDSGVVNITVGEVNHRLRSAHKHSSLEVITLGIKEPAALKVATDDEVNTLPRRYRIVPVPGFFTLSPVFVTVFRVRQLEKWEMPYLSRTIQTHVGFKLRGMETKYEIVIWQNPNIPDFPGDVALSFGS
jgi:hypothetical protein